MLSVPPEPTPMPVKVISERTKEQTFVDMQATRLLTSIRKYTIAHSEEIVKTILTTIWQDGYSNGLKDMDKMHKAIR